MSSRISQREPNEQSSMKLTTGKIFKGTINDAPMKLRVASIPSKFQNVIYRNNKIPAFGNSRDRFYSLTNQVRKAEPGPGDYENAYKTQQKIFSKKGYGTLISTTKLERLQKNYTGLPGPGSYNPIANLLSRAKRSNSLALLSSKLQGHELFKTQLQKSKRIPGPGVYEIRLRKSNSQSHQFSKNLSRFQNSIHNEEIPGVGHYHYDTSSLQKKQSPKKVGYKKPGPQINEISYQQKLKVVRQVLNSTKTNLIESEKNLGPGSYNITPLDRKAGFKIHETSFDRFGEAVAKVITKQKFKQVIAQESDISTLVANEVYNAITPSKQAFSSTKALTSMFKSNLARYDFVRQNINDPGRYSPEKTAKRSHLVNFEKKWV